LSTAKYTKFPGGTQDRGLNNFEPAISADVSWDQTTQNVTGGIRRGVGPRYGVAPLAGHSNTETPAGTATNGIQRSEITSGSVGLTFRERIYGIVPITMAPYDGSYPKSNRQFYLYLVGLDDSANVTLDACFGAILDSSVNKQSDTLVAGLAQSSYRQESPLVRLHKTEFLNLPTITTPTAANMQSILRLISANYWMPLAHINVSGKRIPYTWMLARSTSTPDATTAPNLNLWSIPFTNGTSPTVFGGEPSEIETRECIENVERLLTVYCLNTSGDDLDIVYTKSITNANTAAQPAYGTGNNYLNLTGATKSGAGVGYASVRAALISDPGSFTNSRHDAVLCAGEIPLAIIYQDWLKATKGMMPRWLDLSNPAIIPRFLGPPETDGQPSAFAGAYSLVPVGPNTGILRVNTEYQFGFSIYSKQLDFETNVYFGATFTIPSANDLTAIQLVGGGDQIYSDVITGAAFPWEWSNTSPASGVEVGRGFHINDFEYRFYYREVGTSEWLPGGNVDASQYWFFAYWSPSSAGTNVPTFCRGPVASLPGGQPNGFVDYSPLPKQRYICTTVFQQRAFWWSEKSMHFSPVNNIYAYPSRNITAVPTGKWRGGIVHSQKDLSQQLSRLVVFGDNAFSCRFTGDTTVQSVRVSAQTVGQFAVDGSDFRMEFLCESTAFSYRSACVGEGILYWWGPQGIYLDDGVSPPRKISLILEPEIFSFVDMGRDAEVHAVFNKRTEEVIWFYPPKETDATYPTYGLVYNTINGKFYPFKMRCQVDSAQNIKLENDTTPDGVDGERILLHCRETSSSTIQRTFYFDDLVLAGEQGPARELTVLSVATPVTGTRRLTLATGSVGITAGDIDPNDFISVQNAVGYAPSVTANNFIAKVTAVDNASNWIEIAMPDGATLGNITNTGQTAFPIYHRKPLAAGLSGIVYSFQTNYWLPDGLSNSWYWQFLYFLFKYTGIPTPTDPFTGLPLGAELALTYRSLVCEGALTDTLRLINNSANHCQIHHPMRNEGRAASGQALAYAISGIHIGNPWTLEYLEAHCLAEQGFTLKEFQG
jgi:hypothetical protein